MTDNLLSADGLELWRGERCLFSGLDIELREGQLLALYGPNGSGKTSLLRVLCGLSLPDDGCVRWRGERIERCRETLHAELSFLGHRNGLNGDLSARENLTALLRMRRRLDPDEVDAALERLGLQAVAGLPVRRLSAGQQRRAAFARLLLERSRLWMLDEPSANLDRAGGEIVDDLVRGHMRDGGLAVVASHRPVAAARVTALELGG